MYELRPFDNWDPICFLPITNSNLSSDCIPHKTVSASYITDAINQSELDIPIVLFDTKFLVKHCSIRERNVMFMFKENNKHNIIRRNTLADLKESMRHTFNTECLRLESIAVNDVITNRFGFKFKIVDKTVEIYS